MTLRRTLLAIVGLATVTAASTTNAVELTVIGPGSISVAVNEAFTIDLALENVSVTSVVGLDISASGLAAAGATATAGQSALAYFAFTCVNPTDPTQCFGSIQSVNNPFFNPNDLAGGIYMAGDDSIRVIFAAGTPATSQTGAADPGIDGADLTVPSARDATLTLMATTPGVHIITLDGTYADGTNELPIQSGTTLTVTVPEPTAIASSLASLGAVAAVVGVRRRKRSD